MTQTTVTLKVRPVNAAYRGGIPPGYVREPWSAERREAAREAGLRRSGAKPGHRILHGVQVPEEYFPLVAYVAKRFRYHENKNLKLTRAFIRRLLELLP